MANQAPQSLKNHTRFDPAFHFVLAPITILILLWTIIHLYHHRDSTSGLLLAISLMLFLTEFKARQYATKVQDRIIRLEERLRLSQLAPESFRPQIQALTEDQLVALRFASDSELPSLAARAADQHLSSKQIKEAIQNWRADWFRV